MAVDLCADDWLEAGLEGAAMTGKKTSEGAS